MSKVNLGFATMMTVDTYIDECNAIGIEPLDTINDYKPYVVYVPNDDECPYLVVGTENESVTVEYENGDKGPEIHWFVIGGRTDYETSYDDAITYLKTK